jgi:hypothetical protein
LLFGCLKKMTKKKKEEEEEEASRFQELGQID